MLKTLVMTTGEFEFDTIFINEQELVDEGLSLFLPEITSIMWVMFIIVMPILFSNLLVSNTFKFFPQIVLNMCVVLVSVCVCVECANPNNYY